MGIKPSNKNLTNFWIFKFLPIQKTLQALFTPKETASLTKGGLLTTTRPDIKAFLFPEERRYFSGWQIYLLDSDDSSSLDVWKLGSKVRISGL